MKSGNFSKTELIKHFLKAYEENNVEECTAKLFFLVLSYNTDIREGKPYDHDLKHVLFRANCIRNPMGIKYSSQDYEKTTKILMQILRIVKEVNDSKVDIINPETTIDNRIIQDLICLILYTDIFYKMNTINSKRMDENEVSKKPFVEQLINIILFHQDQVRIIRQNFHQDINNSCVTGMEFSIANKPVEHYENLNSSIADNVESNLESMNEIIHYLYYQFGKKLGMQILDKEIKLELIHPYEDAEFEKYLYIALQRYLLCREEEGVRYGYYEIKYGGVTQEGIRSYLLQLENEEKCKARSIGIFRREYQNQKYTMLASKNQLVLLEAYEKISILANELLETQSKDRILLDFNTFHPDKERFQQSEKLSKSKVHVVEMLTKDCYLDCTIKGVRIRDLLSAYNYLYTLSEILYFASMYLIDEKDQSSYIKEISLVDISYLSDELSRIHELEKEYAKNIINRFIFHEKNNKEDDIFAQPLIKISKTQVILSQALLEQVNLDRFIERQFIRYQKNISEIGHIFEKNFIERLEKGYSESLSDFYKKPIPNFSVNTNRVEYMAFDGKQIEFDVIAILGDYLILTELKAIMTSYDINDLEERKQNIKDAIQQLKRRAESVKHDWGKIKELVSIALPDTPFDEAHIILIACTDAYDFTPLKYDDIFITDDSTYLKYFTNPYVESVSLDENSITVQKLKCIWKNGSPNAEEFKEYLKNPVTTYLFSNHLKKEIIPIPVMDEQDVAIFCEDYKLIEDPIRAEGLQEKKDKKQAINKTRKKVYPNDPCPCGSGKKYKKCCKKQYEKREY